MWHLRDSSGYLVLLIEDSLIPLRHWPFLYRLLSEKSSGKPLAIDKRKSTPKQMSQSPSAMGIVTWIKNIQERLEFLILPLMVSKDLWGEQSLDNKLCHSFPHTNREDPLSM